MESGSGLIIDNDNLFDTTLTPGAPTLAQLRKLGSRLAGLGERIGDWRAGRLPSFLGLPFIDGVDAIQQRGQEIAARYRRIVLFGIGGSSLGGEMLTNALGVAGSAQQLCFYDNIDPYTMDQLRGTDWTDTLVLVVSKSGNTVETLSQFLSLLPHMDKQLGPERLRDHILVITENTEGALHQVARRLDLEIIPHPAVGGRYSALSVVGLLPAAIAGVDITGLMRGARSMAERCALADMELNPAFLGGGMQYLHALRGRSLTVVMAYADRLRRVTSWFRQLWGESLGKRDGRNHHQGLTPLAAHGVTDQHSQLQLYLDGPDDKLFTLLACPSLGTRGERVPDRFGDIPAIRPLIGHTTGELFMAEFEATRATLTRHGRPNRTFQLGYNDAHALGELIVLMEMEAVVVAELLSINPFDQPAVEESKILARAYLAMH